MEHLLRRLKTASPWAVDAGIALLVQVAVTMPFVIPRAPDLPAATWPAYGLTALGVLPLLWRRRAPVAVLTAISGVQMLYIATLDGPGQPLPYAALIAVYTIAVLSPRRRRLAVLTVSGPLIFIGVRMNTGDVRELLFSLFCFCGAYALGRSRLRATRVEAEQAAARERARIAREMHDVLSHSVALMVVQAEAGPVAVRTAPERAEAAFDAIAGTGRDAMTQLRRMLGVLREDGSDPRRPQPVLAELPALVRRVSDSGVPVAYATTGEVRALPPDIETTAFRVVQEALTNAVKHAAPSRITARLDYGPRSLTITVTDDGRGSVTGGGGTPGHGLIGVRERAAAHGGTARTGPGPGGRGFEVEVVLPLVGSAQGVAQ
ncbi:sensor histidine kinase [Streptomyces avermitilis]|uniref:sensor histidine kinase n=1 Tax=Streptomyces avermitilis TaxID=33903 RepID=UPI00381D41ED